MSDHGAARTGNLPSELTSFLGRRREIAEVKRLLGASRLVTLTGSGGTGKTRLSLRVAADLRRAFPDGVWFAELAVLTDPSWLAQTTASALGLADRTARWSDRSLAEYLRDKRLLLILDNCEHLRDACAVLASTLLRAAPHVHILATSRQALGVTGEHLLTVPPLSLPGPDRMPPRAAVDQYEAVKLFVDRATAVRPRFEVTDSNYAAIIRICRQLEGIPLAVELTAMRLRALSVEEVLERLEDRYRLLTVGDPAAVPRHQTLRALIDWSSDLCSEREQTLWSRLSVFSGGFDLSAAESVCAGEGIAGHTVVDLLTALVDKSVVSAEEQDGRVRYRLLEMTRQHGLQNLREHGSSATVRQRHRDHYLQVVEEALASWHGPHQEENLAMLSREHHNLRAALEFSFTEPGQADTGLAMASALWFFWIATGLTTEGRRWLERGLRLTRGRPTPARARALWVCGYLCIIQEDLGTALPLVEECERHAVELADTGARARARQLSGMAAMSEGRLEEAQRRLLDAVRMCRRCDDQPGVLDSYFYLVAVTALLCDPHRAAELCGGALALCDSAGERWLKSYLLWDLGLVAWQLGDTKRAAACGRDGLQLAGQFSEQWVIAFCIEILAWTAHADLKHRRAARLLGCSAAIWQRIGAPLLGMRHLIRFHDQCREQLITTLGGEPFGAEFRRGSQMISQGSVNDAIAFALEEAGPSGERRASRSTERALTPREFEVADLVAEGLSNKAIAAKLVIARRTAEAHVEHILDKLGFSSRAQIAAWIAEQRPALTEAAG